MLIADSREKWALRNHAPQDYRQGTQPLLLKTNASYRNPYTPLKIMICVLHLDSA